MHRFDLRFLKSLAIVVAGLAATSADSAQPFAIKLFVFN